MEKGSLILLIAFALIIVGWGIYFYRRFFRRKSELDDIVVREKNGRRNWLFFVYRFYENVPLTQKKFLRIKKRIELVYPADSVSINKQVTKILLINTLAVVAGVVATLLLANGDIYYILVGFCTTYLIVTVVEENQFRKIDQKLLVQFGSFLTKLRHHYHSLPIIDLAIRSTLDEIPYEIRLHMQKIYEIISVPNMKEEMDRYIGNEPNKYVLMFLSMATSIKEFGDKTLEDGSSLFLTDLKYLKQEINKEIIQKRRIKTAFAAIPAITIFPLFAVKFLEAWAKSNFDNIDQFYSGTYGFASMTIIFVVCFIAHKLVVALRDGDEDKEIYDSFFKRVADREPFNEFLTLVVNRHYTRYMRYNDSLKGVGDHTGARAFLLKQLAAGIGTFVLVFLLLFIGAFQARFASIRDWKDEFSNTTVTTEQYRETMRETGLEYALMFKSVDEVNEDTVKQAIIEGQVITNDNYASLIAQEVVEHINTYRNKYFRAWEVLIAAVFGIAAFFVPVLVLRWNTAIIEARKEDEVVRFQSLMLILMHINGTTVRVILEWMERFSYCFKDSIVTCRTNLNQGTNVAIQAMKDSERHEAFRDFCDNLLTIDKVGVEKAFDEIQADREYFLEKREEDAYEDLIKKSSKAKLIMYVPLIATLTLHLIIPMIYYVYSMFQDMSYIFG